MSQNLLSGKTGYVNNGSGSFSFAKWELEMKTKMVPANNFNGLGYEQYVLGLTSGKATITGPYDEGNMAFNLSTQTGTLTWNLGLTATVFISFPGYIESIKMSEDVENNPIVTLTVQSNGAFTAAIA